MIQGCTSDAGKSVMVAGLCRWLAKRNIAVAPFKPQNMALNSAVTADGGEIGRAQALQARACFLAPHTDMNPILLKPSSDIGAQVIVHGRAIDHMQARQFHDYKKVAMKAVLDSHQRLSQQYQRIIVEGAGSPAEINLRNNDIANMGFAEEIDCPVVLIADIDRGGVFAHLVGTLELLSASEQNRVTGFIINRFRGDNKLLKPGLNWLEQRTGKPVLGVVPYLQDLFLDAEDAIKSSQLRSANKRRKMKVVVPVLPRISNHTDFDALRLNPDIDLQFVSANQACPAADLIILPGSKNVISDLQTLKESGWQYDINRHLRYGGKVIGICGGYQMLGRKISDPLGVESAGNGKAVAGFNLLPVDTELQADKQLRQVTGQLVHAGIDGAAISGYEIHCGESKTDSPALIGLEDGRNDGIINNDNNVLGTYLHGLFDAKDGAKSLLCWAGLNTNNVVDVDVIREQQLDRLAECLDQHLDTDFLQELFQLPTKTAGASQQSV